MGEVETAMTLVTVALCFISVLLGIDVYYYERQIEELEGDLKDNIKRDLEAISGRCVSLESDVRDLQNRVRELEPDSQTQRERNAFGRPW